MHGVIAIAARAVGMRGLMPPLPLERIVRDLTIYLGQPAPDASFMGAGRYYPDAAPYFDPPITEDDSLETRRRSAGNTTDPQHAARSTHLLPTAHDFEAMYRADPDPWKFATSDDEREKYAAPLAALPRPRYRRASEIGCSVGVPTRQLAARCHELLAVDVSETALAEARKRCADQPNVRFARMHVPAAFPPGPFDLILLSEVGHYLSADDLARARAATLAHLEPGGSCSSSTGRRRSRGAS